MAGQDKYLHLNHSKLKFYHKKISTFLFEISTAFYNVSLSNELYLHKIFFGNAIFFKLVERDVCSKKSDKKKHYCGNKRKKVGRIMNFFFICKQTATKVFPLD